MFKYCSKFIFICAALVCTFQLSACSSMSTHDKNVAIGAGVGAVAGSVLTKGGTIGTLGGAVIGGVIGSQIDTDKDKK